MQKNQSILLGHFNQQPLWLGADGSFHSNQKINGAWLAVHTPLDGALLLTTQPPSGFIGVSLEDISADFETPSPKLIYPNLAGIALEIEVQPQSLNSPACLILNARNRTGNPLPLAVALSWANQDTHLTPACFKNAHEITLSFQSLQIKGGCNHARPHLTWCCGWNPEQSGEEVWDDFFASGELGNQVYESNAGTISLHCMANPFQEIQFQFIFCEPARQS